MRITTACATRGPWAGAERDPDQIYGADQLLINDNVVVEDRSRRSDERNMIESSAAELRDRPSVATWLLERGRIHQEEKQP